MNRSVRVIETSTGRSKVRRIVVNLRNEHVARYGFEVGAEVEIVERPDGILIRRKN